jgi:hypothetical protein
MTAMFVSAKANMRLAHVKPRSGGRNQNEHRTRQAIRGLRDMFRRDGLLE